jgi:hypothetical protein
MSALLQNDQPVDGNRARGIRDHGVEIGFDEVLAERRGESGHTADEID